MTWNDGAMPRYCHQACCNEPDTEEDAMSEDTLVERLTEQAKLSFNKPGVGGEGDLLREAAARLTAQAEEIGRLKGLLERAREWVEYANEAEAPLGVSNFVVSGKLLTDLDAALKGQQP